MKERENERTIDGSIFCSRHPFHPDFVVQVDFAFTIDNLECKKIKEIKEIEKWQEHERTWMQ